MKAEANHISKSQLTVLLSPMHLLVLRSNGGQLLQDLLLLSGLRFGRVDIEDGLNIRGSAELPRFAGFLLHNGPNRLLDHCCFDIVVVHWLAGGFAALGERSGGLVLLAHRWLLNWAKIGIHRHLGLTVWLQRCRLTGLGNFRLACWWCFCWTSSSFIGIDVQPGRELLQK
jgi:hypothetical protein